MCRNKRWLLFGLLLLLSGLLPVAPAHAILCGTSSGSGSCFWIPAGGAANWSAGTNWSDTSGGISCSATCTGGPTTGDSVTFDANSGTNGSTIDTTVSISNFNASASTALTLTHNAVTVTVTGTTFSFNSTIVYSGVNTARIWSLNPTGTNTLAVTSAGKSFGALVVNAATGATVQLQDNTSVTANAQTSIFTLTQGILDLNGNTLNAANFLSNNSNVRTLSFGSGTLQISGNDNNDTSFDVSTLTNLTLTCGTGTLSFTYTGSVAIRSFRTGNGFVCGSGALALTIAGNANANHFFFNSPAATFSSVAITCPNYVRFTTSSTLTVSGASGLTTASCLASAPLLLLATAPINGTSTISMASGSTAFSWATIVGMIFSGGATFTASNSEGIGNTGITVTNPSTGGGGGKIIGG